MCFRASRTIIAGVSNEYKKLVIELQILFIQNFHIKKIFVHIFIRNCEFSKIFIHTFMIILRVFIFIQTKYKLEKKQLLPLNYNHII